MTPAPLPSPSPSGDGATGAVEALSASPANNSSPLRCCRPVGDYRRLGAPIRGAPSRLTPGSPSGAARPCRVHCAPAGLCARLERLVLPPSEVPPALPGGTTLGTCAQF